MTMTPTPLRRIALVSAGVTLVWTLCCLGIARQVGLPEPSIHDEFSYLLGADTFVHGRLANPPHPLNRFFDSPYILRQPTYSSMYPPGQSLALALGEKLFGKPYYGVLISGAAMMFLLTMALIEWTSLLPGIAVSAMIGFRILPGMYWVYSYWGGCMAAAGGATVLLAIALYRRDRPTGAGVVFASGSGDCFISRLGVLEMHSVLARKCESEISRPCSHRTSLRNGRKNWLRLLRDCFPLIRKRAPPNNQNHFASRQLTPVPTSTSSGTASSQTPSISFFTSCSTASRSAGGASSTSSS